MWSQIEPGQMPGLNRRQKLGLIPISPDKNRVYIFKEPATNRIKILKIPDKSHIETEKKYYISPDRIRLCAGYKPGLIPIVPNTKRIKILKVPDKTHVETG